MSHLKIFSNLSTITSSNTITFFTFRRLQSIVETSMTRFTWNAHEMKKLNLTSAKQSTKKHAKQSSDESNVLFKRSTNSSTINEHFCASIIRITITKKTKNRRIQCCDVINEHQIEENNSSKNILNYIKKHFDNDDVNKFIFKIFDIWNELNKIRSDKLINKTFIQILNVHLQNSTKHWVRIMLNSITTEMKYLFCWNPTIKLLFSIAFTKRIVITCR